MTTPTIHIVHGQGQSPTGLVARLASWLTDKGYNTQTPLLPHVDPKLSGMESVSALNTFIGHGPAVVVGLGLGGFVAAKLQEHRSDLTVLAVSAPDISDHFDVKPATGGRRIYVHSSAKNSVLRGKTARWLGQAEFFDLLWLDHHDPQFVEHIGNMVLTIVQGGDFRETVYAMTAQHQE